MENLQANPYLPVLSLYRGDVLESVHYGAVAVVNRFGEVVSSYGDVTLVTFLRSSAKPFQVLPFLERDGDLYFEFTLEEIALMCGSHSGTEEHTRVARQIQSKIGIDESALLCGSHLPFDEDAKNKLIRNQEVATNNHNNCSGKHSGMIAHAYFKGQSTDDYLWLRHPVQKQIRKVFAEMCGIQENEMKIGIDGCSAPNFAVSLKSAAWAWARLVNPTTLPGSRVRGCNMVTEAMLAHPEMVSGPGRFDTELMKVGKGKIVSKGGAEGYQSIGLMEGAISPGSEALGIVLKISDGDGKNRASKAVALSVLQQLGALDDDQMESLSNFGPSLNIKNVANKIVGKQEVTVNLI